MESMSMSLALLTEDVGIQELTTTLMIKTMDLSIAGQDTSEIWVTYSLMIMAKVMGVLAHGTLGCLERIL